MKIDPALLGFGRYPAIAQRKVAMSWRDQDFPTAQAYLLPRGNGRSYGDSCLAPTDGTLIDTLALSRLIDFDTDTGVLRCEAGMTLAEIISIFLPRGWLPAVLPGTAHVTVAGAIANDIHGKNHHRRGSFGHIVRCFELLRSDESRQTCSVQENPELFAATIGGLGLSGIITWAEIQLMRVTGGWLDIETLRFSSVDEFFSLARESDATHEYTVAWFDCLSIQKAKLRGVFLRANPGDDTRPLPKTDRESDGPGWVPSLPMVNRLSVRALNAAYFHLHRPGLQRLPCHEFFFPLDSVRGWNRAYGRRGLLQYQCVVPPANAVDVVTVLLDRIAHSGLGAFLSVLKTFGAEASRGLIGFPRPGVTLALDFAINDRVFALLDELDRIVMQAGGAIYPAKDARMSPEIFQSGFPQWEKVEKLRDPALLSAFWQRVTTSTQQAP